MEDKTKSTLAHVASIATAIAGVLTALATGSANDNTSEKIYDVLKERVTIQGEHIKMLEEDKKVKDAWIRQHLSTPEFINFDRDGDGIPSEPDPSEPDPTPQTQTQVKPKVSSKAPKPNPDDPMAGAGMPPPPPPPPEPVQQAQQAFSPMPSYGSL